MTEAALQDISSHIRFTDDLGKYPYLSEGPDLLAKCTVFSLLSTEDGDVHTQTQTNR